ncbi:hypothetical protein K469DRAFT_685134 [Zopfia rhizophila CBS 207.26]|uniref:Uncharacterized protein n=1 Tax=Zopfia rhizophila CBS 207.26 TaxID=1314779 RepID=A0A6A6ED11_9PEZI|nr:hypothetical protein K469DRAFT_685134 [Zopfia rhizophila CBS 207.26]
MSTLSTSSGVQPHTSDISRASGVFQVTIDAGNASSGMINFSMAALARLSQGGIEPSTFGWAVIAGEYINWSLRGSTRFYDALSNSAVQSGFNNILWFGFGHKSPIQILAATDSSSRFAAICACLAEVYSTHMAAQIMQAFSKTVWEKLQPPKPPLPSLLHMHLLVEKCAGIFSTTSFPLWAERLMSFDGERVIGQHAWPKGLGRARYSRGVSKPEDIARALDAVVQLSKGALRHLTLVGVADAGLLAAIGDWLFDLKVAIYSEVENEGGLRYCNMEDDSESQLTVVYTRRDAGTSLTQWGKSLHLQDATLLFKSHAQSKPNQDRVVGGRVPWREAFEGTFGEEFGGLLKMFLLFGTAIGSAARVFSALVNADEDVPEEWLRRNTIYFPDSFGRNFVDFTRNRFPELAAKSLRAEMEKAVQIHTYKEALAAFEGSMSGLAKSCGCKVCSTAPGSAPRYCMVAITATVIRLARTLSGISSIDGLHPTRAGLEYIYETTQTRISRLSRQDGKTIRPMICAITEGAIPDLKWTEVSLLRFAHHVFGGQTFHDVNDEPGSSATVFQGVCCYLDILREPLQDDHTALARVNVLPGHIQFEGRLFSKLGEQSTSLYDPTSFVQPRPKKCCVPDRVVQAIEQCFGGHLELILTETISKDRSASLEVDYEVRGKAGKSRRFGPARAVQSICRSSGLVKCRNDGCQSSQAIAQDLAVQFAKASSMIPICNAVINNSIITIFDGDHVVLLLAAFGCWEPLIQRANEALHAARVSDR